MNGLRKRLTRAARGFGGGAFVVVVGASAALVAARPSHPHGPPAAPAKAEVEKVSRVGPNGLVVPETVAKNMGLGTAVVCRRTRPQRLPPLNGTLALDSNDLARVHSRFAGEVVSLGAGGETPSAATPPPRVGDVVRKGDLLAVVWSKDLGEKKSELVDALSKLHADELVLKRLTDGQTEGSVPARSVWDAERAVEADRVAVARADRTLRAWRLADAEIAAVRAEAERLVDAGPKRADPGRWARVEVRAPIDGVILEKNVSAGDMVDTTADLFKIGNLSHLVVWAHVYEDDLPLLQDLMAKGPVRWTVSLPCRPGASYPGTLEQVGAVIDPNQHTALVSGRVENANGELRVGQFVTAAVDLPAPLGQIELPAGAVVEDGKESVVFVQGESPTRFTRVPVTVARRFRDGVCVRTGAVNPGDRVATDGALLLHDAMDEIPVPKE